MSGRSPAVELAPGVFRIPTLGDFVNAVMLLDDDDSVTLVDSGLKRAPGRIRAALASVGRSPADVQRLVVTHAHYDHAGGAAELVDECRLPGVTAHMADAPFIEAGVSAPIDESRIAGRIYTRIGAGKFAAVPVDAPVRDGDLLPVAGGLRVHHTPGHTPGHISLLHEPTGVLITGDCIFNRRSRLVWPFATFCTSFRQTQQTAHILGELDYQVVTFMHGPHISDGAREAVRGFLSRSGERPGP